MKHQIIKATWPSSLHCLSEAEHNRIESMKIPQAKLTLAAAHTLKREELAKVVNIPAADIEFVLGDHGKPAISPAQNPDNIEFNLSHAGDYVMFCISQNGPIGVDIERIKDKSNLDIAERFFNPLEVKQIKASANPNLCFFELWTLKEAFVKAIGLGIGYGLERFAVDAESGKLLAVEDDYAHIHCEKVKAPEGYVAAIAI